MARLMFVILLAGCVSPVDAQSQLPVTRNDPVANQSLRLYSVTKQDASFTTPITYGQAGRVCYDKSSRCIDLHRGDAGITSICPCDEVVWVRRYKMARASVSTVTISPRLGTVTTIRMEDGTLRSSGTRTFDFANGVANDGLDTGAEAANTWYYLYAVPRDEGAFGLRASVTTPAGGGPTGYVNWKYLGAFRNDAGSSIVPFWHLCGNRFQREEVIFENFQNQNPRYTNGPTQITLSSYIPATASAASIWVNHAGQGATYAGYVDSGAGAGVQTIGNTSGNAASAVDAFNEIGEFLMPTPTVPKTYYRTVTAIWYYWAYINGWTDGYVDLKVSC